MSTKFKLSTGSLTLVLRSLLLPLVLFGPATSRCEGTPGLFPCPDCGENVSRRAVSCPDCGCPGGAIQEAVRSAEEKKRPKRLVEVSTDANKGRAVAVRQNGDYYFVMDLFLMGTSPSLSITELGTANQIGYSDPELASDAPLLRLKTTQQAGIDFLAISSSPSGTAAVAFLTSSDQALTKDVNPEATVVALDQTGAVAAMRAARTWFSLQQPSVRWIPVKPADLRYQMDLLTRARKASDSGPIAPAVTAELAKTEWLTPYLKQQSSELLHLQEKAPEP